MLAMDDETVDGISPSGRERCDDRLADHIAKRLMSVIGHEDLELRAEPSGHADGEDDHDDVEDRADKHVGVCLEGRFSVENERNNITDGGGDDIRIEVAHAIRKTGEADELEERVVRHRRGQRIFEHDVLQQIEDAEFNDRGRKTDDGEFDKLPKLGIFLGEFDFFCVVGHDLFFLSNNEEQHPCPPLELV